MKKVLFVCTGNTCRSPMAEAILNYKGKGVFEAKSAGLYANIGQPANEKAKETTKQQGITLEGHGSQPINKELVAWADVIYTMTENHKRMILEGFPDVEGKVFTLKEAALEDKEESQNIWSEWHKLLADLEITRASYAQKLKQANLSNNEIKQMKKEMNQILNEKTAQLTELERRLPDRDIADPFGGSREIYEAVYLEIGEIIDMLINREKNEK